MAAPATEAFMALELVPNALEKITEVVRYHPAFASLSPRSTESATRQKAHPDFLAI